LNELVLYGVGSSLVVEYLETCRRLGCHVIAGVKNRSGAVYLAAEIPVVEADSIEPSLRDIPALCPLFTPSNRYAAVREAAAAGFVTSPALIDPTSIVASTTTIGDGSFVNAGSVLGAASSIGDHVVINRGCSIGHHVRIDTFASIGPSVVLGGLVTIGTGAMIGASAVVLPRVTIGAHAIVGAGSVVVHDVAARTKVLGNPARVRESSLAEF
jgi:sugar O-acyltransferase (sialic acid O-acetyltransferase NeuD family)